MEAREASHRLLAALPIVAAAPVHVQVDEARDHVGRGGPLGRIDGSPADAGDTGPVGVDVTDHPALRGEDGAGERG